MATVMSSARPDTTDVSSFRRSTLLASLAVTALIFGLVALPAEPIAASGYPMSPTVDQAETTVEAESQHAPSPVATSDTDARSDTDSESDPSAASARRQNEAEGVAAFDAYRVTDEQLREAASIVDDNVVFQRRLAEAASRDVRATAELRDLAVADRRAAEVVLDAHESEVVDFVVATYIARPESSRDLERLPTPHRQPPPIDPVNDRLLTDVRRARAEFDEFVEFERRLGEELSRREAELGHREDAVSRAVELQDTFDDAVAQRNQTIEERKAEVVAEENTGTPLVMVHGFRVNAAIADDLAALLDDAASRGEDWIEPAHCSTPPPAQDGSEPVSVEHEEGTLASCERPTPIIFGGGAYRPRANQIELRIAHCGTSEYLIFDSPSAGCSPPTARPGRSQHELGLAIDFTENGAILSRSSPGYRWLVENAERYGLKNLPSEPWHWSTTGK